MPAVRPTPRGKGRPATATAITKAPSVQRKVVPAPRGATRPRSDAFSQAFTNPLLSEHVWGDDDNRRATFTEAGIEEIEKTSTLATILERNSTSLAGRFVGMTRPDWQRE